MDIQCFICTCAYELNHMHIQNVYVYVSADGISSRELRAESWELTKLASSDEEAIFQSGHLYCSTLYMLVHMI
jgi:hypothetical protein